MHAIEYLSSPERLQARPIYAVFGDDAYLRREVLNSISLAALGEGDAELGAVRFPGDQATLADVLDEVRTLPFLAKRRVVVVEGADPFVTAHRKELEAYAERPSNSGVLVLSVKSWPASTKLFKTVEKTGTSVDCKTPPERALPGWLDQLSQFKFAAKLDHDAASLLVELMGPEVGLLAAEVEKLSTYVGEKRRIRREDVAKLVGAGRVEVIWTAVEAATTGDGASAIAQLERLLTSGEEPVKLLAAITATLRKVHHAGQLRRTRLDLRDACREAGIPAYPAAIEKTGKQHAHLGPTRVARLPDLLLRADLDLKGASPLPPRVILERLLVQLSLPRQD